MKKNDYVKSGKYVSPGILANKEKELLDFWVEKTINNRKIPTDNINIEEFRDDAAAFVKHLIKALSVGNLDSIHHPEYGPVIEGLSEMAQTYVQYGLTPSETAFIALSLKNAIVDVLNMELGKDHDLFISEAIAMSEIIYELSYCIVDDYVKKSEDTISEQMRVMSEMATPVILVWKNIILLPLVGILDSMRAQQVMESCLDRIIRTESKVCILDISGVPSVDTAVANHIINITKAIKLVGARCIISGMSSPIAQTIVHLGLDLSALVTTTSLRDALMLSFEDLGLKILEEKDISRRIK